MFFRRRPRPDTRADRWRTLATRLDLVDASDHAERVRRWLDLDAATLAPLYALRRPGLPSTFLFDALSERRGPSGAVRVLHRYCLVRSESEVSRIAFRATARQDKVLESLQASRSGAVRVAFPHAPSFDQAVSLYARDATTLTPLLTQPLRSVLQRLLAERAASGTELVVGARHMVVRFVASEDDDLTLLEQLLADSLSLASLLPAVQRAHDELSVDDLLDVP